MLKKFYFVTQAKDFCFPSHVNRHVTFQSGNYFDERAGKWGFGELFKVIAYIPIWIKETKQLRGDLPS